MSERKINASDFELTPNELEKISELIFHNARDKRSSLYNLIQRSIINQIKYAGNIDIEERREMTIKEDLEMMEEEYASLDEECDKLQEEVNHYKECVQNIVHYQSE